jgi:hypothetical protein
MRKMASLEYRQQFGLDRCAELFWFGSATEQRESFLLLAWKTIHPSVTENEPYRNQ